MAKSFAELFDLISSELCPISPCLKGRDLLDAILTQAKPRLPLLRLPEAPRSAIASECQPVKEAGAAAFRKQDFPAAALFFTQLAALSHDCQALDMLHSAYANRSAAHFRMGRFETCLDDLAAADEWPGDGADRVVLLERKGHCLANLGRCKEAAEAFRNASEELHRAKALAPQIKEAMKKKLAESLESVSMKVERHDVAATKNVCADLVLSDPGEKFPTLSASVGVFVDTVLGRHLRAVKDIPAGQLIIREPPLVTFSNLKSSACLHCLADAGDLTSVHPSPKLKGIFFCSWPCFKAADAYHRHEIPLLRDILATLDEIENSGCMHLALRAVIKVPSHAIVTFADRIATSETSNPLCEAPSGSSESELEFLLGLIDHETSVDAEERKRVSLRSVLLARMLQMTGYVADDDEETCFRAVALLLYRLQLGIAHNLFAVYSLSGEIGDDIPLAAIGSAVYSGAVLCNHSCACNTIRFYDGSTVFLVSRHNISAGEEITINYGVTHLQMNGAARKRMLSANYKFDCACVACASDYPTLADLSDNLPKSVRKSLEKGMSEYRRSYACGNLGAARAHCSRLLSRLSEGKVARPNKAFEMGTVALMSCWWATIAAEQRMRLAGK